jgi:hypothetical protein
LISSQLPAQRLLNFRSFPGRNRSYFLDLKYPVLASNNFEVEMIEHEQALNKSAVQQLPQLYQAAIISFDVVVFSSVVVDCGRFVMSGVRLLRTTRTLSCNVTPVGVEVDVLGVKTTVKLAKRDKNSLFII